MHICLCSCWHVCMFTCQCAHLPVFMLACVHVHLPVCTFACVHAGMCACSLASVHICLCSCWHVCMFTCQCAHLPVFMLACVHVHLPVCTFACVHAGMCACSLASVHICLCSCWHVCMFTCQCAHLPVFMLACVHVHLPVCTFAPGQYVCLTLTCVFTVSLLDFSSVIVYTFLCVCVALLLSQGMWHPRESWHCLCTHVPVSKKYLCHTFLVDSTLFCKFSTFKKTTCEEQYGPSSGILYFLCTVTYMYYVFSSSDCCM